jgi:predicted DCC family thiol-disulfide oxidoreductase YuxK
VILFDGLCDLCHTGVAWLRARDRMGRFEFLPYQSEEARRRFPALDPATVARAIHVVTPDGRLLVGADSAPWLFSQLPRWRWLAWILALPGVRHLARPTYAWIAARRRLWNRDGTCRVASPPREP